MSEHTEIINSLNNALAYSWVLGWYAGRDGATNDNGKIQAMKDTKANHPDIVLACNAFPALLAACEEILERTKSENTDKRLLFGLIQNAALEATAAAKT